MQISAMPKRKEVENLSLKIKKLYRKLLTVIIAAAVLCSALPMNFMTMTASAAATIKRTITYYEKYRRQSELKIGSDAVLHYADWAIIYD